MKTRAVCELTDGETTIGLAALGGFVSMDTFPLAWDADQANLDDDNPGGAVYVASYKVVNQAECADTAAAQVQKLNKLMRKARQYHTTSWQTRPVYLQERAEGETDTRYAIVYGVPRINMAAYYRDWHLQGGFELMRETAWRSGPPGILPSPLVLDESDGPDAPTLVHVASMRETTDITHIYSWDATGAGTFSGNLVATTAFPVWSVLGSTPATGDMFYIGSTTAPLRHIVIPIATPGTFTANVQIEYWDGAAWTMMHPGVSGGFGGHLLYPTGNEDQIFKTAGAWAISLDRIMPVATVAVNAVVAYWMRLNLQAVALWTATPWTGPYIPYSQTSPHIGIPASRGDFPAIGMFRFLPAAGGDHRYGFGTISRILLGLRTNNTTFVSHLNCGGAQNPAGWAITNLTDASTGVDARAPGNAYCAVSYASNSSIVGRLNLRGTAMLKHWAGTYKMYLAVYQSGGAAGDLRFRVRTYIGDTTPGFPAIDSTIVVTKTTGTFWEILDMGVINIPFAERLYTDLTNRDLIFQVHTDRITGTATAYIGYLVLMPVDEWAAYVDDPISDTTSGPSALRGDTALDFDGGILKNRTIKYLRDGPNLVAAENWNRNGPPLRMPVNVAGRVFVMMLTYGVGWGDLPLIAYPGTQLACQFYRVERDLFLRGASNV